MNSETIKSRQAITLYTLFMLGTTILVTGNRIAGRDSWIALIVAAIIGLPYVLICARILTLNPGKSLFDIAFIFFKKFGGWVITLVVILYAFALSLLVLRNATEFIQQVALHKTPQLVVSIIIALLSAWALKKGLQVLGRSSVLFLVMILSVTIVTTLLMTNLMDFDSIKPIMGEGIAPVAKSVSRYFSFPIAESFLLLAVFHNLKKGDSQYKSYSIGLLIGTFFLGLITLRNILVLGVPAYVEIYFPSFMAAGAINLITILERIEGIVVVNYTVCIFIKLCICIYVIVQGCSKLSGIDYKKFLFPISLLIIIVSQIAFKSTMELFRSSTYFFYWALPIQLIIPIGVWIVAEIVNRKKKAIG